MDIEFYFNNIKFKPVAKDGKYFILEARVSTGEELLIRVISLNKSVYLKDMRWAKLWGLHVKDAMEPHKLQSFLPPEQFATSKLLTIHESDSQKTVYMNDNFPYIVTVVNQDGYDQFNREDRVTLPELLASPSYEVKRFG